MSPPCPDCASVDPCGHPRHFVEPCPECAAGKHENCDGRTLDHATDEIVPCPCRAAGHA